MEISLLLDVQERKTSWNISTRGLWLPFPPSRTPLKSLGNPGLPSEAIQHFSGHIFVVFSLQLMCTLSQCCFVANSDSSDEILNSGLSFPFAVRSLSDLNSKKMVPRLIYGCCDRDRWFVIPYVFVYGTWLVFFILSAGRWTTWFDRVYLDVCYFRHKVWWSAVTRNVEWSPGVKGFFLSPSLAWVDQVSLCRNPCIG